MSNDRVMADFRLIDCGLEHAPQVLEILNDAILTSTANWGYEPHTLEQMQTWFRARQAGGYPIIAAIEGDSELVAYATYGPFRRVAGYRHTVEHSVYIREDSRNQGLGSALLAELIERARLQGMHVMVGGVDARNEASKALHLRFGFQSCGTIREAGQKFDEWLDLEFYQLILTPDASSTKRSIE